MGSVCSTSAIEGYSESETYIPTAEKGVLDVALWRSVPPDFVPIDVRVEPSVDGPRTGESIPAGETFRVSEEFTDADGIHYLKLADGSGWVYVSKPGVGMLARVVYSVDSGEEEEAGYMSWRCIPPDSLPIGLRATADIDGPLTGSILAPGEIFRVSEEVSALDGMYYLRLQDGRGWTFVAKPNVGIFAEPEFWRYQPSDGLHVNIRAKPNIAGPLTGHILPPGEVFCVSRVYEAPDGYTYLKLADGRGWVFVAQVDVGVLCVPHEYVFGVEKVGMPERNEKELSAINADELERQKQEEQRNAKERIERLAEAERKSKEEIERFVEAERKAQEELARVARVEADYRAQVARLAAEVTEWQQRAMAESTAKQEAELRVLAERRAKEEATHKAEVERMAALQSKNAAEHSLRAESEQKLVLEASRLAEAERRAQEEAERRAEAERVAAAHAKEAQERAREAQVEAEQRAVAERKANIEVEQRLEAERKAKEEAERRVDIERLAAQRFQETTESQTKAEAERLVAWRIQEEKRIAEAESTGKERAQHRALVEKLADEVAQWQNQSEVDRRAKLDAEARAEAERVAKETAERRVGIERLAASQAQDNAERMLREGAERMAREEADRFAETEKMLLAEAHRFAEVERLAAQRAREAAEQQLRVQAERRSFVPGEIPQPYTSGSVYGSNQSSPTSYALGFGQNIVAQSQIPRNMLTGTGPLPITYLLPECTAVKA